MHKACATELLYVVHILHHIEHTKLHLKLACTNTRLHYLDKPLFSPMQLSARINARYKLKFYTLQLRIAWHCYGNN